ncbi:UDP-N-acetylmuramate--L-alanine ligase [Candidatus Peregrinibacteria bacterium]|nr:UDP-N-acetylmuramate--L-alanine ligase [Candidatus Peregrinibacteria bacterium]
MNIFCSGIGGIGLSAYASLQKAAGYTVAGSDRSDSALLQSLREQGIEISLKQDGSALPDACDLLVYSEAIPADAPERKRARELGIRSISYFQGLGEISKDFFVVAVCGTHGKSSTTAMAARVLIEAGKDPSVVVGTKVRELDGKNFRKGKSDLFLLEACEYRKSFHSLSPDIVLMTNVDGDHFDAFKDMQEYHKAFSDFLSILPPDGVVITHGQDPDAKRIAMGSGRKFVDADAFPLPKLSTPGEHMRQNARLVLALAEVLKIPQKKAEDSLSGFAGTWRRMEVKGERDGITIVDDYAHHPKEIRATLAAMREAYPERRIVCVFQPHTHDRTLKLYDDFLVSFKDADVLIVPDVYDARHDIETATVDLPRFVKDIATGSDVKAIEGHTLSETEKMLWGAILKSGDVLVCMGAGDITQLAGRMMS